MSSIIGFTVIKNGPEVRFEAAIEAQQRALAHFPHLKTQSLVLGDARVDLWGHDQLTDRFRLLKDGSLAALIGSPIGELFWPGIEQDLLGANSPEEYKPDWDGRFILLWINAGGSRLTTWCDWLGSIPVFHAQIEREWVASTLEPVTFSAADLSAENIFLPGLLSLFINGHFLADWTLFENMRVAPPDSVNIWDDQGFRSYQQQTIIPNRQHWETSWDDLVDEMYALTRQAISDVLLTRPNWVLPLSAGLDSRLIAGVAADLGLDVQTYSWGAPEATDVVYARQIARALKLPWQRIDLGTDYLTKLTPIWADLFGSSMQFHGMYQIAFLQAIRQMSAGPVVSGFLGEVLSGADLEDLADNSRLDEGYQFYNDWYTNWNVNELEALFLFPVDEALDQIATDFKRQLELVPGAWFQRMMVYGFWNRQRFFTSFHSTLNDYWRGVGSPFINRDYARFTLSLPRVALDGRRLLNDMYRRHYGLLATIPGTYSPDPLIPTGSFLLKRRLAENIPNALLPEALKRMAFAPLRMDTDCLMATGKKALWPIWDAWDDLGTYIDTNQVTAAYEAAINNREDVKPLRKLQSVQALAYRLT